MADVVTNTHVPGSLDRISNRDTSESGHLATHLPSFAIPESNPPFVFPILSESHAPSLPRNEDTISKQDRVTASRHKPQKLSISALPAFEFGEDSSDYSKPSPSPTRTSARMTPPISSTSGHRRGGSEFVGGNVANPITANVSPTMGEDVKLPPSGPPITSRRGHAHKRSGALSQHDLTMILRPGVQTSAGSAPNTPSDVAFPKSVKPDLLRSSSEQTPFSSQAEGFLQPDCFEAGQNRARVTFSNDPEYIPRPLSIISSETSSSMSTVRAGHSLTNSITSLTSGGTSSPPSSRKAKPDSPPSKDNDFLRPGLLRSNPSEERVLRREVPGRSRGSSHRQSPADPGDVPSHSHQKLGSESPSDFPLKTKTAHPEDLDVVSSLGGSSGDSEPSPRHFAPSSPTRRPRTSPEPQVPKPHRKQRPWSGMILPRKSKQHFDETNGSQRSPQKLDCESCAENSFSLEDVTFDEDTTCIIENTIPAAPRNPTPPMLSSLGHSRDSDIAAEDSASMLDIDAALSCSERPSTGSFQSDPSFPLAKRRLHSSGELGGFSGPGMHYHRRAESAPELDFFEQGRLGFAHRSSNPAMAEAIEEEEEGDEEEKDEDGQRNQAQQDAVLGVHVVEKETAEMPSLRSRRQFRINSDDYEQLSPRQHPSSHLRALDGVEIVNAEEEPRFSVVTKSSDESSITPTMSPEPPFSSNNIPLHLSQQIQPSLSTPRSPGPQPSPDYSKSSFDAPENVRVHTAHSSITDRTTLNSSRAGDQALVSVDDVPSLTSSASTMISGHPTRFSSGGNTTASSADRSFSLSATAPGRLRSGSSSKRSSLVSLSRLVGGSYNRSKLNIAELATPDSPEKSEKKKGRRMSRLKFWKSRDKGSSTMT